MQWGPIVRRIKRVQRKKRETQMFAKAMHSKHHPILAQIIPTRRCNLSCTYCNEFDKTSDPVPTPQMLARIDALGRLGTAIITLSGGEPMLHPDLDLLIARIRSTGAIATLITNGYFLVPERIRQLNAAGLDYLQISIDNAHPDETSKKSLKVLDQKLRWLAEHAEFDVTINSVLGSAIANPDDALSVATRARELGFASTLGILHDHDGQLKPLSPRQQSVYDRIRALGNGLFSHAHFDKFQLNIARGLPNDWHCRAGSRFLYICEDGLVHWCSQQRGTPAIPLDRYTAEHFEREFHRPKPCAPLCTISCVHQTAMLDSFREQPREALAGIFERRRAIDPDYQFPPLVRALEWMFLNPRNHRVFTAVARRVFGLGSPPAATPPPATPFRILD